ncbi:ADP-ribosyltransferase family protein [Nocardia beijingensis]|uniref:hypothetical protein n=1 Tax=Nocardia beijingensis TaxID=95162 RepID=UPI002B4AB1FC|nr:hypothetical protein [Nocardia beijingensis]
MTVIDVSASVYYDTAQKLADAASQFWAAIDAEWPAMAQATNMAGSYSDAKKWGESYDHRAEEILTMVGKIANAAHGYATILQDLGYNHATAEHNATIGNTAPPPEKPAPFIPPVIVCRIPLPSAGGPGNGLVDEGIGLCEMIGIIVPDGNAGTISNAADTWARTAAADAVAAFPAALEAAAVAFDSLTAPEVAFIDEDLRAVKAAAETAITAMRDLSQSCRDHRAALDELRNELRKQCEAIRDALYAELAINAAVSLASAWITLGASAAIGVAGAAAICARFARPIRLYIESWRTERRIAAGVKLDADIARHVREMERLEDLTPAGRLKPKPDVPPKPNLTDVDRMAIDDYAGLGSSLNTSIREGIVTPVQQGRIDRINEAIDKLPAHEGMVYRKTNLPPEVLEQYQIGDTVLEKSFTSYSKDPERFTGQVEMQVFSKSGKDISGYVPDVYKSESEVLYKSPTPFRVVDRFPAPDGSGRIIIQLEEL